jgi:hypothetical protein
MRVGDVAGDICRAPPLLGVVSLGQQAASSGGRGAGAYTRPLFGSTSAHSVEKGCNLWLFRGCIGGVRGYIGVSGGVLGFVSETAQVELRS